MAASIVRLANESELVELLAKEPGKCDNFAEEILRHESPVQGLFRMTTADVEVAGVTIPNGSLVNLRYGSANRDERKYECPEVFKVARANAYSHSAFGEGLHHCLGPQMPPRGTPIPAHAPPA